MKKNKDKETDYINDRITTHKITKHNKTRIALTGVHASMHFRQ